VGSEMCSRARITASILLSAAAVCAVAVGVFGSLSSAPAPTQPSPASRPSPTDTHQAEGEYTQTAAWRAVGEQIRQARRADPGLTAVIPVLLSAPIDVTGPGTYTMEIGPVPATTKPGDVAMTLPPDIVDHFTLRGSPLRGITFVHRSTGTFVQVHLAIDNVRSPYHHLTAWFQ
jgi:hypothetical protein